MFDSVNILDGAGLEVKLPAFTNVDGQKYVMNTSMPFGDLITMGLVPGVTALDKWGVTDNTSELVPVDAWEGEGEYTFETTNSITHIHVVNTGGAPNADVGKEVEIGYQLLDGTEGIQSVILGNDGVFVPLAVPCLFILRMINRAGANILGNAQASVGTSLLAVNQKAYIMDGNNQTQMAVYRVPKNKVAFLKRGEVGIEFSGNASAGSNTIRAAYRSRRQGQAFTIKKSISMITNGTTIYGDKRTFKDIIPSLTEFKLSSMKSSESTIGMWGAFDLEQAY